MYILDGILRLQDYYIQVLERDMKKKTSDFDRGYYLALEHAIEKLKLMHKSEETKEIIYNLKTK